MKKTTFLCCLSALCACTALFGTACNSKGSDAVFTVTFDSAGGSAVASQEVKCGEYAAKPADPTKSGYTFDNWYADKACVTVFDFAKVAITADWTLYANWNVGGGGGGDSDPVDPLDPVDPVDPTEITYTCTGLPDWITNDGCVIFAWAWEAGKDGSWVSCEYGSPATQVTFKVQAELEGFLLARCIMGTTTPDWTNKTDTAGRVYNKTQDIICSAGVYSYVCSDWVEAN